VPLCQSVTVDIILIMLLCSPLCIKRPQKEENRRITNIYIYIEQSLEDSEETKEGKSLRNSKSAWKKVRM